MTEQFILDTMKAQGRADAMNLASRAIDMTPTEIIAEERKIPAWNPKGDYSDPTKTPIGTPVRDGGQVWILLQLHNAAHYPYRPTQLRSLWGLAHSKDPKTAKPWVPSYGTSGLYMLDECCTYLNPGDGLQHVYRNNYNNNEYPPHTLNTEDRWEDLGTVEEVQSLG